MKSTSRADVSAAVPVQEGVRAYPISEAFQRLGVSNVQGYKLVNSGELETFTIGTRRYATDEALRRLIQKRIAQSLNESPADRAAKVKAAVKGRARQRDQLTA